MSNPIRSVRLNDALLMHEQVLNAQEVLHRLSAVIPVAVQRISRSLASHQALLSLVPELKPTEELIHIREKLQRALPGYSSLQQECCLLKLQADRLSSSISIFLASPVSLHEAPRFLLEQDEIMERFDLTEEYSQHLLFSLDHATHALLDKHT